MATSISNDKIIEIVQGIHNILSREDGTDAECEGLLRKKLAEAGCKVDNTIESVESKSTLVLLEYRHLFGGIDAKNDAAVGAALTARGF